MKSIRRTGKVKSIGRTGKSIDRLVLILLAVQVVLLVGKLGHKMTIPWWAVFIPGYPVAAAILLILFGVSMAARSKK